MTVKLTVTSGSWFVVILLKCLSVHGDELRTYNIEDNCGFSISRYDTAGILRFNSTTFSDRRGFERECKVKVVPEQVEGSRGNGKILFYFTEFDLPGFCADSYVSLTDGSSKFDPPVSGTPATLCGHNATLTKAGLVFNTSHPEFSVILRWAPSTPSTPGSFALKFSSYYDGPCRKSDVQEAVTCLNNRCINKAYHCHNEIDTCGVGEEAVCDITLEEAIEFWETVKDSLISLAKNVGIFIAVAIGLFLIFRVLKATKLKNESIASLLQKLTGGNRGGNNESEVRVRSRAPSVQTVELNQQTGITDPLTHQDTYLEQVTITTDDHGVTDTECGPAAPPPSYDALSPLPTAPPLPYAAPPTYDDVISDGDRYQFKQ